MQILYKPSFLRDLKKLPKELQEEVFESVDLFKSVQNHKKLRVHALRGKLKGLKGFSVNYAYRILFQQHKDGSVSLIAVGNHDMYK